MPYRKTARACINLVRARVRLVGIKSQKKAEQLQEYAEQLQKQRPPWHKYKHYDHPDDEEHRTAEQFNWRTQNRWTRATAIGAIVAAFFAGYTFYETWRQANYAKGQLMEARAQTEIQRQLNKVVFFVSFQTPILGGGDQPPDYHDQPIASMNLIAGPTRNLVNIETVDLNIIGTVKNFGNDLASVETGDTWLLITNQLPISPVYAQPMTTQNYSKSIPPGPYQIGRVSSGVFDKGNSYPFGLQIHIVERHAKPLGVEEDVPLLRGQIWTRSVTMFVYGRVIYTDTFGYRRQYGYGRFFSPQTASWEQAGGSTYNYDRSANP